MDDKKKIINIQASGRKQHELLLQSWKLTISEIEITYDDKENKMIYDGHTLFHVYILMDIVNLQYKHLIH